MDELPRKLRRFLDALEDVTEEGENFRAVCPVHGGHSLLIRYYPESERIVSSCKGGCGWSELAKELRKLGCELDEDRQTYTYCDASGDRLFQQVRFRKPNDPKSRQYWRCIASSGVPLRHSDVERKTPCCHYKCRFGRQLPTILYRLNEVVQAIASKDTVYLCEGPKDADRLRSAGVIATSSMNGASDWNATYLMQLAGVHKVVLVPDLDRAGYRGAYKKATSLQQAGIEVEIQTPAKGKDAFDHFANGLGLADLRKLDLAELKELTDQQEPELASTTSDSSVFELVDDKQAIQLMLKAINGKTLPDVYQRGSKLVRVDVPEAGEPLITEMIRHDLRLLSALHWTTYRTDAKGNSKDVLPTETQCSAVLRNRTWKLPELHRIVRHPLFRLNGTLLQNPGFDTETGFWYCPSLTTLPFIDPPSSEELSQARSFLLEDVLGDFPFASLADRANQLALMLTPPLSVYINGPIPLGVIGANMPGSGKSQLCSLIGAPWGMQSTTFEKKEDELAKKITSILRQGTSSVLLFDNVDDGQEINSPMLAKWISDGVWSERILGVSEMLNFGQGILVLANGNNIHLGKDLPQRAIRVILDTQNPHPESRTDFKLGPIDIWLRDRQNLAKLSHSLLVVLSAWFTGGPEADKSPWNPNRKLNWKVFTRWAETVASVLEFLDVPGFAIRHEADETDHADLSWMAFLRRWHAGKGGKGFGSFEKTASELLDQRSASGWRGTFPDNGTTRGYTPRGLGRVLSKRVDRFVSCDGDSWVLRSSLGRDSIYRYWPEHCPVKDESRS